MVRDLGITELSAANVYDWIVGICLKRVATVSTVRDVLRLQAICRRNGVKRKNAIVLVWEETTYIVRVRHS